MLYWLSLAICLKQNNYFCLISCVGDFLHRNIIKMESKTVFYKTAILKEWHFWLITFLLHCSAYQTCNMISVNTFEVFKKKKKPPNHKTKTPQSLCVDASRTHYNGMVVPIHSFNMALCISRGFLTLNELNYYWEWPAVSYWYLVFINLLKSLFKSVDEVLCSLFSLKCKEWEVYCR